MSKNKPTLCQFHQLQQRQLADFYVLLSEKTRGTTRDGKPYLSCRVRDRNRSATWQIWADSPYYAECDTEWSPGQFLKLRGVYSEHDRYGPQVDIQQARLVTEADQNDGFRPEDYLECSRFDPQILHQQLCLIVTNEVQDEPLKKLVLTIVEQFSEKLKALPAHPKAFYPFPGGWLEHTVSVARTCIFLADQYRNHFPEMKPPLNRDMIVAGAVLHDIGRVVELAPSVLGVAPEASIEGHLFGHLLLGRDVVRQFARDIPELNPELVMLLEHIILTHLKLPEWGSPRLPVIPEVLIVHYADDLDAKFEMYARCLQNDQSDGPFTDRDPILGKALLKTRSV